MINSSWELKLLIEYTVMVKSQINIFKKDACKATTLEIYICKWWKNLPKKKKAYENWSCYRSHNYSITIFFAGIKDKV